jgi:hypothetical protein
MLAGSQLPAGLRLPPGDGVLVPDPGTEAEADAEAGAGPEPEACAEGLLPAGYP